MTYFEFGTLAAMQLFSQARVDVAILEVGLGGRLDAVNIFDADCAVLTSIDFDHMDYLGNTREEIGLEKAGIFRSGRAAICSEPDIPAGVRHGSLAHRGAFWLLGQRNRLELLGPRRPPSYTSPPGAARRLPAA